MKFAVKLLYLEAGEVLQEIATGMSWLQTTAGGRVKTDADITRYFESRLGYGSHHQRTYLTSLKGSDAEMPRERRNRLQTEWGLSDNDMRDVCLLLWIS